MFKIQKRIIYAIEAVLDIALNAGAEPVQNISIAKRQGIPKRYLEQTLQVLVKSKILVASRGPRGGYRLAKDKLAEKIANNIVTCAREKNKDKYKRTVAECFINEESLSSFMVKNGYACDYIYYSKGKYAKEQKYAKANKLGVWKMKYNTSWENKCRKK